MEKDDGYVISHSKPQFKIQRFDHRLILLYLRYFVKLRKKEMTKKEAWHVFGTRLSHITLRFLK